MRRSRSCVVFCALLGLFLGSSSRRLLGDYLAIVTLFFGQAFVVFTNATDPYGITNGSNGLANVDPLGSSAGHAHVDTTRGYYWFLLGVVVVAADRAPLPQRVPDRPRVEGARARTRSRPR